MASSISSPIYPPPRRRIFSSSPSLTTLLLSRRPVILLTLFLFTYLAFHRAKPISTKQLIFDDVMDENDSFPKDPPREELEEDDIQPDFPQDNNPTRQLPNNIDSNALIQWSLQTPPPSSFRHGQERYVMESISMEEWNTFVHESVRNTTTKLVTDVYFHRLTDQYGLIDLKYSTEDLLKMMARIVQIWAQANIHVRFWLPESLNKESTPVGSSEAYKIYVTGNKEENSPELLAEKAWLARTVFGKDKTEWLYDQMLNIRPNSCCIIEKMLVGSESRTRWQKQNTISFYPMFYLRWYNGFSLDRMVVIRGGSCWTPENKMLDGIPVRCKLGYADGIGPLKTRNPNTTDFSGARDWERFPFTWKQFARIAAHEIGHYLGLDHWNSGRCTKWNTIEEANLMSQQKRVSIPGFPCGMQNRFSEDAVALSRDQIATARALVKRMDAREVPSRYVIDHPIALVRRVGQSMEQEPDSRTKLNLEYGLLLKDTAPCNGKVVTVRFKFHKTVGEDGAITDPEKRAHFAVFSGTRTKSSSSQVQIRHSVVIELSTRPYHYQRHLAAECEIEVKKGDLLGAIAVMNQKEFPIGIVAKSSMKTPSNVYFTRITGAQVGTSGHVTTVDMDITSESPNEFRGMAPFFGLDVVCDGGEDLSL